MIIRLLALTLVAWLTLQGSAQDEKMTETVKGQVKKIMDATVAGDYRTVLDLTHPKVLEMMGGKETALKEVEKGMNMLKSQGFTFKVKDIGSPAIVKSEKEHYSVTPFVMIVTGLGKKVTSSSALIGVSADAGKTWKFINLESQGEKGVRTILPDLPASVVIPKPEQKVEKND